MSNLRLYYQTTRNVSFFYIKAPRAAALWRVYGAKFIYKKSLWVFPAIPPYFEWVLEDLESQAEGIEYDSSVDEYVSKMEQEAAKIATSDIRGFRSKFPPYDHQKAGLSRLMHFPRYAVFWDPGMGKTKLICDRILYQRTLDPECRVLVLALRVNLSTWVNEMNMHSEGKEELVSLAAPNPRKRAKLLQGAKDRNSAGVVCTYETARVSLDLLSTYKYDMIVADECHKMQSYKSKLTVAALELSKKAAYRYVLSGTPTKGKPTDVWASLRFLGEFIVPKYWDFDKEYVKRAHHNRHIVTGYKNLDLLNDTINTISDTKKSEDCLDLPERTFQEVYLQPSPTQRRVYNSIVKNKTGEVTVGGELLPVENLLTKLGKLAQICSGFVYKSLRDKALCDSCPHMPSCVDKGILPYTAKCKVATKDPGNKTILLEKKVLLLDSCAELCEAHVSSGKKVIVWAKHRETLDSLYHRIADKVGADSVLRYDSTAESPGEVENEFNTNPNKKVIIAQITMGIGVTFKAPIMIYTELSFNLADWLQSLDRNWGIRAKGLGPILVQVLLIRNSIYEQAYNMLKHKIDVASIIKDKPKCSMCPKIMDCIANKVSPYDPACILDKSVDTLTVKLKEI